MVKPDRGRRLRNYPHAAPSGGEKPTRKNYTCLVRTNRLKALAALMEPRIIGAYAAAFFGVAFLGVAFFFGVAFLAAVFFGADFFVALGAAGAVVLVTRPDFVLPRTRDTSSSTAGAGATVLRGRPAFAFGLGATAAFFGAAFAVVVFLGAAFLVVEALAFCGLMSNRLIRGM